MYISAHRVKCIKYANLIVWLDELLYINGHVTITQIKIYNISVSKVSSCLSK